MRGAARSCARPPFSLDALDRHDKNKTADRAVSSIKEVILDLDDNANQTVVTIHWAGGCHTELRVARVRTGRYPDDRHPSAVEVVRKMGGDKWPDRDLAVTMNRMRCKGSGGNSWTTMRVRELRERLGVAAFRPNGSREETISVDETARRLSICVGSVYLLIRSGALPAKQIMPQHRGRFPSPRSPRRPSG